MATKTDGAAATTGGVADGGDQQAQLQEDWTAFVKWFRSNGGIISSKLTVKVRNGRQGVMPPWQAVLGEEGVSQVTDYVMQIGEPAAANHPGKPAYDQNCIACHGANGAGNLLLGAPDITDDIWLYGNSRDQILDTIANGRTGVMPPFQERLDDVQIKLLVALLAR